MKKKTHKIKKHYKPLPPHTWEAHTTASHGEVNKQLIIGIITIVAVVVLASLLFFTDVFVGQAITFKDNIPVDQAGIFLDKNTIGPGEEMTIPVHAHLPEGKESTVVKFELSYDSNRMEVTNCDGLYASLDEIFIEGNNDFSVIKNEKPCSSPGMIVFEFAALTDDDKGHVIKGLQKITDISFKIKDVPITSLPATLTFIEFNVYDLDGSTILPLNIMNADIAIVVPEVCSKDNLGACNTFALCDSVNGVFTAGICTAEIIECTDSDGGIVLDVKGTSTGILESPQTPDEVGKVVTKEDSCGNIQGESGLESGTHVVEYICEDNLLKRQWQPCSNDLICGDGYCQPEPQAVCSSTNLAACDTSALCDSVNGVMVGDVCTAKDECSKDNLGACTVANCEGAGGVWDSTSGCTIPAAVEDCLNSIDDDGDGLADCLDSDCDLKGCAQNKVCISSSCTSLCIEGTACPEGQFCDIDNPFKLNDDKVGANLVTACKTLVADECSPINLGACDTEVLCESFGGVMVGDVCTAKQSCSTTNINACVTESLCQDVNGVWDGTSCSLSATEQPEIKVELIDSLGNIISESLQAGVTSKVEKDKEYNVVVTISPETDLPDNHLVLITVKSGAETKSMFYDTKPLLPLTSLEVVKFNYKPSETGIITVSALVWGNWPSSGEGNYLVQKKEVNYEAE
jgi:hypothetical protein